MPSGPGTYGKQVGRPAKSQKDDGNQLQDAIAGQMAKKQSPELRAYRPYVTPLHQYANPLIQQNVADHFQYGLRQKGRDILEDLRRGSFPVSRPNLLNR